MKIILKFASGKIKEIDYTNEKWYYGGRIVQRGTSSLAVESLMFRDYNDFSSFGNIFLLDEHWYNREISSTDILTYTEITFDRIILGN